MGYSLYHVGPIWDKQYSMGKLRENFELQVTALKSGFSKLTLLSSYAVKETETKMECKTELLFVV